MWKKSRKWAKEVGKLFIVLGPILAALVFLCTRVHAQATYVIPQSLTMSNTDLFGSTTVGAAGNSTNFTDVGNTVHYVSYSCTSVPKLSSWIESSRTGLVGTYQRISTISYDINGAGLTAYGYEPNMRIHIETFDSRDGGTCVFKYTGTSVANASPQGIFTNTGATLLAFRNSTTLNMQFDFAMSPTNGRLGGSLWFQFNTGSGACSGLTIVGYAYAAGINDSSGAPPDSIRIQTLPGEFFSSATSVTPASITTAQSFSLPDMQATDVLFRVITPVAGAGCGTATFTMWYSTGPPTYGQQMQGAIPAGGADNSQYAPTKMGCVFETTPTTVSTGQEQNVHCNNQGALLFSVPSGSPISVQGTLTDNNAPPAAGTQLGVLPAVANAVAPTVTEGDQVLESTDLKRQTRVVIGPPGTADTNAAITNLSSSAAETNHVFCAAACNAWGVIMSNANAATRFLQCFNATSLPANATVPSVAPVTCISGFSCSISFGNYPLRFTTGLTCAISSTQNALTVAGADALFTGVAK